jgi:hypothetical protein
MECPFDVGSIADLAGSGLKSRNRLARRGKCKPCPHNTIAHSDGMNAPEAQPLESIAILL